MKAATQVIRWVSPAKINLFLEILKKRPNGYHEIDTLFQEISLADSLTVRVRRDKEILLSTTCPGLVVDQGNLVSRAAHSFKAKYPLIPGLSFKLIKRIPLGAGLGGGSGNAATTLLACRSLSPAISQGKKEDRILLSLAKKLGADVPFFLRGGFASARGVGDRLTFYAPIKRRAYFFVLVFPRVFSSTPDAYRALHFPLTKRRSRLKLTQALRDGAPASQWAPWLFNRLEEVVLPRIGAVALAKRALIQAGCLNALMSGSGSSVFGLVENPAHGRRVLARLHREPWDSWLVSSASCRTKGPTNFDEVGHHGYYGNPGFVEGRRQT